MSLKITRAGILDTVQDLGRWGYQHLGIGPGGAMDRFSASLANALLGKDAATPVIELHFPAAEILVEKPCVLCLTGADFSPTINGVSAPLNQPVFVPGGAVLRFEKRRRGARGYLSLLNELALEKWLHSYSTHLKAGAGGYQGRRLLRHDVLPYERLPLPGSGHVLPLPWRYHDEANDGNNEIEFILGSEWDWLTPKSQTDFLNNVFTITPASDRMGYRLQGEALAQQRREQLVSSAVSFGTLQLLPNGQLIVLMADHQTTGGYPRIGHVVSAHLSKLAQKAVGDDLRFALTTLAGAEDGAVTQRRVLALIRSACGLKMQTWLQAK